jgi:hypothetical protein
MAEASLAGAVWREKKIVGLSCGVDQNEEVIGKMFCEFLVAKMDEFKWNFEFE